MFIEVPLFSETSPALKNPWLRACINMIHSHALIFILHLYFHKFHTQFAKIFAGVS